MLSESQTENKFFSTLKLRNGPMDKPTKVNPTQVREMAKNVLTPPSPEAFYKLFKPSLPILLLIAAGVAAVVLSVAISALIFSLILLPGTNTKVSALSTQVVVLQSTISAGGGKPAVVTPVIQKPALSLNYQPVAYVSEEPARVVMTLQDAKGPSKNSRLKINNKTPDIGEVSQTDVNTDSYGQAVITVKLLKPGLLRLEIVGETLLNVVNIQVNALVQPTPTVPSPADLSATVPNLLSIKSDNPLSANIFLANKPTNLIIGADLKTIAAKLSAQTNAYKLDGSKDPAIDLVILEVNVKLTDWGADVTPGANVTIKKGTPFIEVLSSKAIKADSDIPAAVFSPDSPDKTFVYLRILGYVLDADLQKK